MEIQLAAIEEEIKAIVASVWAEEDEDARWDQMVAKASELAQTFCQKIEAEPETSDEEGEVEGFLLQFEWSEQAKHYLLLWRDVLFESQKAAAFHRDGTLEASELDSLARRSEDSLQKAADELIGYLNLRKSQLREQPRNYKRQLKQWRLQKSPWPIYKEQIEAIPKQCQLLREKYQAFFHCIAQYQEAREHIHQMLVSCENEIEGIIGSSEGILAFVEDALKESDNPKPGRVVSRLDEMEANYLLPDYFSLYAEAQEDTTAALPEEARIPIDSEGGMIRYRDINLRRRTRQWLETEIRPALIKSWEETKLTSNSLKLALVNVRNRAILLSKENNGQGMADFRDICQPVEDFLTSAVNWRNELKDNRRLIEDRISESFRLSNIYHTKQDFLPIPLQTSLRQLRLDESPFIARIEELYVKVRTRLQSWISRVEHEESLGLPEKIVRAVQSRQLPREGSNYSNIFLSRGFIGESFAVGRQEELRRIKKLINNWRLGYRGSVLLHGQRFSGKSLLGEWVASRYFDDHFVRLQPNATIEFNGRRQKVGTDLEEALAFVRKNSLNQRTLVWIDDLELWWSEEVPLLRNARSLMRYINQYGQSLFFLVATSNWVRQDLTCLLDWGQAFQAQINLDRMSFEDIHQAIMIRHGATHRTLVDDEGETVSSAKFEKMVKRVYQSVRANPGEAMMRWTLFTHNRGEDEVRHRYRNVSNLPDFLNPDQLIVLRILMMKKQATEYELRKMFGPAFKTKYSQHIQQLLSLGLLNRRLDGELEVNEYVVNDLGRSLEQRQVLRFNAR